MVKLCNTVIRDELATLNSLRNQCQKGRSLILFVALYRTQQKSCSFIINNVLFNNNCFLFTFIMNRFRVLVCFFTAVVSFLMVSFSSTILMSIFGNEHVCAFLFWAGLMRFDECCNESLDFSSGVVFASISSGLGELSFLSLSVFFSR